MPFWIIVLILNLEMRKPCWCSWPNCCFLTLQSVLQLFRAKLFSFWIDFSRDFNQKLLLNNFLITSTSETSHGLWKIQDIFLMPTVERSLMVSKTVVKVSDWEPEDCNNFGLYNMAFFGSYSLGTIFSDLINVRCTICNIIVLDWGGVKDFLSRFFQTNLQWITKALKAK